jgi:prepilin-type processing-associated H-X9-DG protein
MRLRMRRQNGLQFKRANGAFARLELLVMMALLALLALLTIAAVSSSREGSQSALCLANLRSITIAWQQYATDEGRFPPNPDDGNITPGRNWIPGQAGRGGAQEFNPDLLADPRRSLLFPHLPESEVRIFRCPAENRVGRYQGADPSKRGSLVPAARSYAMNVAVGTDPYDFGGILPVHGAWLDNNHSHQRGRIWRTYGRFEDIVNPIPAQLAVLLDEDAFSLNDGVFAFGMEVEEWIDWPAARHHGGGTVSFADGHVSLRRWLDERTVVQSGMVNRRRVPGSPDHHWLRGRISAPLRP